MITANCCSIFSMDDDEAEYNIADDALVKLITRVSKPGNSKDDDDPFWNLRVGNSGHQSVSDRHRRASLSQQKVDSNKFTIMGATTSGCKRWSH